MGLFNRFSGPDEEDHNPSDRPTEPESAPAPGQRAPRPRPTPQAGAQRSAAAVRPVRARPQAGSGVDEQEAEHEEAGQRARAAGPSHASGQPPPSPTGPGRPSSQPGWLGKDGMLWSSVVAQHREDGHLQTRDGGQLWDVPGKGIVMAEASAQAMQLMVSEVIQRGWSPVVIEATDRTTAARLRDALTAKGIKVEGRKITAEPGVWDDEPAALAPTPEPQPTPTPTPPPTPASLQPDPQQTTAPASAPPSPEQGSECPPARSIPSRAERLGGVFRGLYGGVDIQGDGLIVLESEQPCWDCKEDTPIFIIEAHDLGLTNDDGEPETVSGPLMYVESLSPETLEAVRDLGANWKEQYSRAMKQSYIGNACTQCDSLQGDHHIHEGNGAFGPMSRREITIHSVPVPYKLSAGQFLVHPEGETLLEMARLMQPAPSADADNKPERPRSSGPGM